MIPTLLLLEIILPSKCVAPRPPVRHCHTIAVVDLKRRKKSMTAIRFFNRFQQERSTLMTRPP